MPQRTETRSAADFIPPSPTLASLREAAVCCRGCDLYRNATQTVFGEGGADARIVLVGEKPGDHEDREGHPFVGPSGRLLDRALADAGIARSDAWVTNVVKHFKYELRGKRRIHGKPNAGEINACRPWLDAELSLLKPRALVCLGATAAQALLGRDFRVTRARGQWVDSALAPFVTATVHPSAILRSPDDDTRHRAYELFVADLRRVAEVLA